MTPRDRYLAALRGEPVDRVPIFVRDAEFKSAEAVAACADAGRREIARRIWDRMAPAWIWPTFINRYLVTPPQFMHVVNREQRDGGTITTKRIDTPKGPLTAVTGTDALSDTVWTVKYSVETLDDVEKIRSVPWEPPTGLSPPDLAQRPPDFDRRWYARIGASSPMVCVAGMMPYQTYLLWCATEINLIRDLTDLCLERILAILDVVLSEGTVEVVWIGGSEWLTPPMASPRLYEELVQPHEAAMIERIHAAGALAHGHCHGRVRSTIQRVIDRGADYFEPVEPPPDGDITMAEAKAVAAGRMTLGGNVEARILATGTPDEVEAAARAAFDGGKDRMVLRTSAFLAGTPFTPNVVANFHRLIDVWEERSPV